MHIFKKPPWHSGTSRRVSPRQWEHACCVWSDKIPGFVVIVSVTPWRNLLAENWTVRWL